MLKNPRFGRFSPGQIGVRWSIINFSKMPWDLISRAPHWTRCSEPKDCFTKVERWPNAALGATEVQSLSQGKIKVGFLPWVVRWSKGSCFKSTKVNPWHSQTTNRSIRDHFSIKQNHQGPSQRRLTNIWKNPKFGQFQWGGRWVGGDWPTSSKWFKT